MYDLYKNYTFKRPPFGGLLIALTHPLAIHEAQNSALHHREWKLVSMSIMF